MTTTNYEPRPTGELPIYQQVAQERPRRQRERNEQARNWFFIVVGWPLILLVLFVLFLRWRPVMNPLIIALVGLSPALIIPLAFGIFSSWFSRSATLRVATAVTTVAFLFTVSPVDAVIGCRAASSPDEITLYTANVLRDGGRPFDVASSVLAADPDVLFMQEVQWEFLSAMRQDTRMDTFSYRTDETEGAPIGTVVWSRFPIANVSVVQAGITRFVSATIDGPTGRFTVTGLHATAPSNPNTVAPWNAQLAQLAQIDTSAGPQILAGDFNATSDHQPFRQLLNQGWTDVHDQKGCGFDATWPVDGTLPVSVLRLDHVLVTDDFEVLGVRFADPAGSDHKPVVAKVRLRTSA